VANHSEIVFKFATRQPNKRHKGQIIWNGSRIFCRDDIIFSYGTHFPLAKYLGERNNLRFFVKNSDKYSSSTSAHQSMVRQVCHGPSVSRSDLSKYIHFEDLTINNVHLWRQGCYKHVWKDVKTGLFYEDADYQILKPGDSEPKEPFFYLDEDDVSENHSFDVVKLERSVYVFKKSVQLSRYGKVKFYRRQRSNLFQEGMFSIEEVLVLNVKNKYLLSVNDSILELTKEPKTIVQALSQKRRVILENA
jgi:hypothetical protein